MARRFPLRLAHISSFEILNPPGSPVLVLFSGSETTTAFSSLRFPATLH